jgi:hypothetical protein
MNKRGIALILSYMVIGVLVILGVGLVSRSVSERNIAFRYVNSNKAFWLAEAGVARAIKDFSQSPLSGFLGDANNTYSTQTSLVGGFTDRYRIISVGSVTLPGGGTIDRTIEVIVQEPQLADINNSITTSGDLTVGGSADVEEPYESNAAFTFQGIFGMTEAQLKAQADHLYTDPPNNVTPVDGITWIEITPGDELIISSGGWSGSGILIVEGDLKITGGDFEGILWVSGDLDVASGSPDIEGAIFVDCGTDETRILGNADVEHDEDVIDEVFGDISPVVISWAEL